MKAIILAAGKSTRLNSDLSKVLHPILGKTVVQYVVEAAQAAGFEDVTVVIGASDTAIENELSRTCEGVHFAVQDPPLGTGHAVAAGMDRVQDDDDVLIFYGDMPLITAEIISEIADFYRANPCEALATAVYLDDVGNFGRVYDNNGIFTETVEKRDMKPDSPHTNWANTGPYLFKGAALRHGLSRMTKNESKGEYYLTDVPKILADEGRVVRVFHSHADISVFAATDTQAQLAEAVGHMRTRINERHMAAGVRMIDPASVFIDADVKIARGTVIYPGTILEGNCEIGENAIIGPNTHMKDTFAGASTRVRQSVTDGARIGAGTEVGPFAYLRPGTVIGERCRIGNFVEIKNSVLGNETKMAHLAYIGDADVGNSVNYSCGAITANYDGKKKHRTVIKDGAFIGCNVNLVAPVEIGEGAYAASGSTITENLPADALGVARGRQYTKPDWAKAKREKDAQK